MIKFMKISDIFTSFSGLKPNKSKCYVIVIRALKRGKLA